MCEKTYCDVIILGGGPAGMTAAIYAARAGLHTVLLEKGVTGGLVNATFTVENFPTYPHIHGMELMEKMREHVESLAVRVEEVCEIQSLSLQGEQKIVTTDEGIFLGQSIILCTGREPLPLPLDTDCDSIHYCAICDGGAYKGKRVLVVGGGNSAFDESLYMLTLGVAHITLIESMDRFFAAQTTQDQLLGSDKVDARNTTEVVELLIDEGVLTGAVLENTATKKRENIAIEGLFVFLGQTPNSADFADTVELSEKAYILVDEQMRTNIPGVFAAGDITEKTFRQITTAMADGTIAALAAEKYIRK